MPNLAEVNLTLKYYKENHSMDIPIPLGITVSELKDSFTFAPKKEIQDCYVVFKSETNQLSLVKDTEIINSDIRQAKEILMLSVGGSNPKKDAEKMDSSSQYSWFDELPEDVKNRRMTPAVASLLAPCFGSFWECVFYRLGFTPELVDLEVENCGRNTNKAATKLLMKWEHKHTKEANYKHLVEQLVKVHTYGCTTINWKSVKEILSEKL